MHRHSPHRPTDSTRSSQRGSILVYLAITLVAFGVLAIAGSGRFGASMLSVSAPNCATQARHMAESGVRYAMAYLRGASNQTDMDSRIATLNGQTYNVDLAKGLKFTLAVTSSGSGKAQVSATGSACGGAIFLPTSSALVSASVNVPAAQTIIDFSTLADDFFRTTDIQGNSPISIDPVNNTISFGIIGQTENAAAIWYSGNATSGCLDGNCTMTHGLRAYFTVQWTSGSVADGLVFGVISGEKNTVASVGGDPDMGELMGWGGPGPSGLGLQPPKIGLELDTWYNECYTPVYTAPSRCDPTKYNNLDHMAYVFWGSDDNTSGTVYSNYYRRNILKSGNFYDDNRHGAGSGNSSEPVASNDPDSSGSGMYGLYYTSTNNWLRGGTKYYIRYELIRLTTPSASAIAKYCYLLKTWITSAAPSAAYQDVTTDFDANANPPTLQQVIFLSSPYHEQLGKILFGWTEATGSQTQNLTVGAFNLAFKKAQPVYGTAPANYTAYWPMHDNLGASVTDIGPSGRTGTITGAARWVPGIANPNGSALAFNGSTYMSAADNAALQLSTVGGVSLWFKMTAAQNSIWLLHKGDTSRTNECYGLQIDGNGRVRFRLRYGTGANQYVEAVSTTTPAVNRWYHVAATWQNPGTNLTLYINGVSEGTAATNTARNTNGAFYLGTGDTGANEFTGVIDEVYLYKKVLSQSDVTALATGKP